MTARATTARRSAGVSPATAIGNCRRAANYWSSTSSTDTIPDGAWIVYFDNGGVTIDTKIVASYVRAVRGGL
jgi:hypothetical protein